MSIYSDQQKANAMIKIYESEIKKETNRFVLRELRRRLSNWRYKYKCLTRQLGYIKNF